jgi:serine/threonine-protein kinase
MAYARNQQYAEAVADLSEALKLDPFHAQALYWRGVAFSQLGDYPRALADFNSRLRLPPPDPMVYFARGLVRADSKSWNQAVTDYTEALRMLDQEPDRSTAAADRGNVEVIRKRDKLWPERGQILNSRGFAYLLLQKYPEALTDLNEALKLRPEDPNIYYNRGKVYDDTGSHRAALADYRKAVELDPNSSRFHNQLAWLLATCSKSEIRNGPLAVEHATKAVELDGEKDGNLMDTLAGAYAECGRFDEAVRWQQKAIELAPPDMVEAMREHLKLYQSGKPSRKQLPSAPSGTRREEKAVPWWKKKKKK